MKVPLNPNKYINAISSNNLGPQLIIDILKKKSKYKFSKIKYFNYFSPELVFEKNNLVLIKKEI